MSCSRKERLKLMPLGYAHLVYLEENRLYILIEMKSRFLLFLIHQEVFLGIGAHLGHQLLRIKSFRFKS